jgi:hypothetical protein
MIDTEKETEQNDTIVTMTKTVTRRTAVTTRSAAKTRTGKRTAKTRSDGAASGVLEE